MLLCCLSLSLSLSLIYSFPYTCKTLKWLKRYPTPSNFSKELSTALAVLTVHVHVNPDKDCTQCSGSRFQIKGIRVGDAVYPKVQVKRNAIHLQRHGTALFSKLMFFSLIISSVLLMVRVTLDTYSVLLNMFHQHHH